MIRLLLTALLLLVPMLAPAQAPPRTLAEANARLNEAHTAYDNGDFTTALRLYEQVAEAGFASASVWANAGAAAYRSNQPGRAVLYYRRALRLDPAHEQALQSLRAISPKTNDAPAHVLTAITETVFRRTTPGLWAVMASIALLAASAGLYLALRTLDPDRRGRHLVTLGYAGAAAVLFALVAAANHHWRVESEEAVVMVNDLTALSAPDPNAEPLYLLPAGTVLRLLDPPVRGFVRVRMADGTAVFVPTSDLERV